MNNQLSVIFRFLKGVIFYVCFLLAFLPNEIEVLFKTESYITILYLYQISAATATLSRLFIASC